MRINVPSLFVLLALVAGVSAMAQDTASPPSAPSAAPAPPAPSPPEQAAATTPPPSPPQQEQSSPEPLNETMPQLPNILIPPPPVVTPHRPKPPFPPEPPPVLPGPPGSPVNAPNMPGSPQLPERLEEMIQAALANNPDIQVVEAKLHEADVALAQVRQQVVRELTQSFQERTKLSMQLDAAREQLDRLQGSGATDPERQDPQLKVRALEAELAANQAQLRYLLGAALEGPQPASPQPGPNMEPTPQRTGPPMGGVRGFGGMGGMGGGAWGSRGPGGGGGGGAWSSGGPGGAWGGAWSSGGLGGGSSGGYGGGMSGGYGGSSGGWGRAVGPFRLPVGVGSPRPPIPARLKTMLDSAEKVTITIEQGIPLDKALEIVPLASKLNLVFAVNPPVAALSFTEATCEEILTAVAESMRNEICFVFRDYGVLVTETEQAKMMPGATIPSYIPYLGPPVDAEPRPAPGGPAAQQRGGGIAPGSQSLPTPMGDVQRLARGGLQRRGPSSMPPQNSWQTTRSWLRNHWLWPF